jgi:hypothetical protein
LTGEMSPPNRKKLGQSRVDHPSGFYPSKVGPATESTVGIFSCTSGPRITPPGLPQALQDEAQSPLKLHHDTFAMVAEYVHRVVRSRKDFGAAELQTPNSGEKTKLIGNNYKTLKMEHATFTS